MILVESDKNKGKVLTCGEVWDHNKPHIYTKNKIKPQSFQSVSHNSYYITKFCKHIPNQMLWKVELHYISTKLNFYLKLFP